MRCPKLILGVAVVVGVLLIAQDKALAVAFNVPITLQTATGYTNEVTMTLGGAPGTPTSNVATGDYTAQLDVSFDSENVATINSIKFLLDEPGHMAFGSMSFNIGANVDFANIMATFSTPDNPVAVTGGVFGTTSDSGNRILLNGGTIDAGAVGGPVVDLAIDDPVNQPISNVAGGAGTISVSTPYLSGGVNTYDVTMIVPVSFSQDLVEGVPAVVSGTLYGVGSFSAVPEPGTVAMLIAGALALLGWAGLRRR